ncbi:MAG: glycosyltransferase family 39 protein [Bacteroidetes bacterium]|nr:glycosyltransferase family 39 protein [Bacteroidota bacterium]
MGNQSTWKSYAWIVVLSLILFLPFLGSSPLFDWDEINFAESAREMVVTGDWSRVTVNYEPFWEKPPLFIWIQAVSISIFGPSEFAARFPNVLIAICTFCLMLFIGNKHGSRELGGWWILLYAASITPNFYLHSGIIDPLFNFFIFCSVYHLYRSASNPSNRHWWMAGIFLGLAVLTKGPAAILIVGVTGISILLAGRIKPWFGIKNVLSLITSTVLVASFWFLPEVLKNGMGFLQNFIVYQLELATQSVASHGQPWFYHFVVLFFGVLPASIIFIASLSNPSQRKKDDFAFWAMVLFWVVLIIFSLVRTKIVHYSSMCYLPMTYLAARYLTTTFTKSRWWLGLLISGILIGIGLLVVPYLGMHSYWLDTIKMDSFTRGNLSVQGGWNATDFIPGVIWICAIWIMAWGWRREAKGIIRSGLLISFLAIQSAVWLLVPNVQRHTQGAAIDFYRTIADQDVYVDVYGFKSYAHYFYTRIQPVDSSDGLYVQRQRQLDTLSVQHTIDLNFTMRKEVDRKLMDWMIYGDIDKDVYLVCQEKKIPELRQTGQLKMIMREGGYAAFVRRH